MYNFDPYNVLLAIATNIAVLLMTAFVLQGHLLTIGERYGVFVRFSLCCLLQICDDDDDDDDDADLES